MNAGGIVFDPDDSPRNSRCCEMGAFCGHQPAPDGLTAGEFVAAKEMADLSPQTREGVYHDVHGIPDVVEENPQFLKKKLKEMDKEIAMTSSKGAYDRALFLSPRFVKDQNYRLMFLRSHKFDVKGATIRYIDHFRVKLDLFGPNLLVKHIAWDDLEEEDHKAIAAGATQCFSERKDRAGRPIMFDIYSLWDCYPSARCQARVVWYHLLRVFTYDEEAQKKGFVMLALTPGTAAGFFNRAVAVAKSGFHAGIPCRLASAHYCFDKQSLRPLISTLMNALSAEARVRLKMHFGTSMVEIQYSLNSYGLPMEAMVYDIEGKIKFDDLSQRINQVRLYEARYHALSVAQASPFVLFPREQDILLGRGITYQQYPGNQALREYLEVRKPEHQQSTSQGKTRICLEVRDHFKANGCLFLRRDTESGMWSVVDDEAIREKIAMGFRNLSRQSRR